MEPDGSITVGLYGKVPARGDFITRRLPMTFVRPWDDWLQAGIVASRGMLGDAWLECYMSGPLWRFALPPGVAGPSAAAGVLMPSVDAANRHFPLTTAALLPEHIRHPFALWQTGDTWFDAAEDFALSCLDQSTDMAEIETGLDALRWPEEDGTDETTATGGDADSNAANAVPVMRPATDGVRIGLPLATTPLDTQSAFGDLLNAMAADRCGDYSLWWTTGSDFVAPTVWLAQGPGLPAADAFAAFLSDPFPVASGSTAPVGGHGVSAS